jgi:tetratricopeptide (TPR) repeat protein
MRRVIAAAMGVALAAGCASAPDAARSAAAPEGRVEALSLMGRPLFAPELAPATRARLEADLAVARRDYERNPQDPDAIIWLGRRLAYLGQYRAAIDMFSEGVSKHPGDARMYRHRGHRYITIRQFGRAVDDLQRAAELVEGRPDQVEPDGAPNRFNIPVSTLNTNVWYHLALAHYLRRDFHLAAAAWERATAASTNDDMLVASSDWLFMTLRRLGRDEEAARVLEGIRPDMTILENDAYHRRLLMYRGMLRADELMPADTQDPVQVATYGYGLATWYLVNGQPDQARTLYRRILEGRNWAAFGFIAAEAELAAASR